jgi:chromosome partitioning protein
MPVIVVASPKGGVGKSTTANILMTCLARHGATVTGIDADANRPQIKWARRAGVRTPQYEPADPGAAPVLPTLTVIEESGEESLIATIQAAAAETQFVIVDLEGVASQAATFAISQADGVIIPSGLSFLEASEATQVFRVVAACEKMARQPIHIPAAVLLTKTSPAIMADTEREVLRQLQAHGTPMFETWLHKRTAFAAIFGRGVPLHDLPAKVHKLDVAVGNAEAFVKEAIRMLDQAQAGAERAVA